MPLFSLPLIASLGTTGGAAAAGGGLGSTLLGVGSNLLGGLFGNQALNQTRGDINALTEFNPFSTSGPFGNVSFQGDRGTVTEDPISQAFRGLLGQQGLQQLQGGMFLNPDLQGAFQGANLTGNLQGAQAGLGQQMGTTAFGGLGGIAGNAGGLGNLFAQNVAGGPQDLSRGLMGNLFQGGQQNLQQAGQTSDLVGQSLAASRALAQPFEQDLINQFANREFMKTRGATSGAERRQQLLQGSLLNADQQRILNAQQLGLQNQQQLGQLGLGQVGAGTGLLGQNLAGFGQQLQGFGDVSRLGLGAEQQGFGQMLQALQQNQSAGQQRLQNAMNIFGLGQQTQQQAFGQGLQAQGANLAQNQFLSNLIPQLLNAAANQVGATGLHAQALGQVGQARGGFLGGLLGGIGDLF